MLHAPHYLNLSMPGLQPEESSAPTLSPNVASSLLCDGSFLSPCLDNEYLRSPVWESSFEQDLTDLSSQVHLIAEAELAQATCLLSKLAQSLQRPLPVPEKNPVSASAAENNPASEPAPTQNPIPPNIRFRDEIYQAAKRHNIDPLLLAATAAQETGGPGCNSGANIIGDGGAGHGVFQIDSGTWSSWLRTHDNGMNVAENADKAASILADNLQATDGDVKRALHRYNAGTDSCPSTQTEWPDHQSLSYEDSVLRHLQSLQGAISPTAS